MRSDLRSRKEKEIIMQYDPISRDMTVLDLGGNPYRKPFHQGLIVNPARVVLEIDSQCNFRCQYCSEGKNPPKFNIARERVIGLIDEAEKMQVPELTLRGGEATLHPAFYELWDYASKKDFLSVNVITNGFVFDTEKVRGLLQNPRSKVIVSLDGFPEINSLYRNPAQFNKVLSWLEPTLKERPGQVVLLSVIYRQNYEQLPLFARAMAAKGLEFFHLSPLKRLGRSEIAETNFVSYREINKLQGDLEEIARDFPRFNPTVSCVALKKYNDNKTVNIPMPFFTEMHFGSGVKITPQGKVMVNRGIMFTDRFKQQYVEKGCLEHLGSIYDGRSFEEIWTQSLKLRLKQAEIAQQHYGYYLGWMKSLDHGKSNSDPKVAMGLVGQYDGI